MDLHNHNTRTAVILDTPANAKVVPDFFYLRKLSEMMNHPRNSVNNPCERWCVTPRADYVAFLGMPSSLSSCASFG